MPLHVFIFESWWICPGISALFPGISAFFPGISAQKNRHIFTQSRVRSAQKARNPKLTTIIKKWPFPAPSQEIRPKGRNLGNGHLFVSFRRFRRYIYIWCSVGHPPSPPPPMGMGGQYRLVLLVPPPVACGGGMVLLVPPPCGLWWWYGSSGPPPLWPVVVVCWYVGIMVCWYVGMSVCWYVGMLVCWYAGMYVCMYVCRYVCMYIHHHRGIVPPPSRGGGWEHGTRDHIYIYTGWWYTYPSENMMEFVSWDDDIPNWIEKQIMFQSTNQYIYIYVDVYIA